MTTKRPFIAIYCDKLRETLLHLEKADFRVLQALMLHMDPIGVCYPGPALLAELTKHAETTVEAAIMRLQQLGYIRILVHQNPIKRKTEFAYIVSPHLHAVHESNQSEAWQYWQAGQQYYENSNSASTGETKDSQPPPKAPTEPTPVNHRQELPPPPPYQPSRPEGEEQENASTNTRQGRAVPAAQAAKSSGNAAKQRQSAPPVPQLPPGAGQEALPDSYDEAAAQQLQGQFRGVLTLVNARRVVLQYGRENALAAAFVALSDPTARSAVAVMIHNLRHGLVTPGVDDATPVEWNRLEFETRTVNFQLEWQRYSYLLDNPDCPDWFRDRMAYMAENYPQEAAEAATVGD